MEYDDLYDESPYISKDIPKRGGAMGAIRTTFLICAIILASVLGLSFYGYWQDQFILSASNDYVAIFDKKSKTMNVCDRVNCTLITPRFPDVEISSFSTGQQGSWMSRLFNPQQWGKGDSQQAGQRLLGSFPQPQQMPVNPQMMQQMNPQMMPPPMNPQMMQQMTPQMMGRPQQMAWNPQMAQQQMPANPQMANRMPQASEPEPAQTDDTKDNAAPDEGDEEAAPV